MTSVLKSETVRKKITAKLPEYFNAFAEPDDSNRIFGDVFTHSRSWIKACAQTEVSGCKITKCGAATKCTADETIQWHRDCTFTQQFATSTGRKLSSISTNMTHTYKKNQEEILLHFQHKEHRWFQLWKRTRLLSKWFKVKHISPEEHRQKEKERKKKSLFYQRARCSDRTNTEFKICHSVLRTCQRFQHLGTMKRKSLLQNVTNISPTHPQTDVSV